MRRARIFSAARTRNGRDPRGDLRRPRETGPAPDRRLAPGSAHGPRVPDGDRPGREHALVAPVVAREPQGLRAAGEGPHPVGADARGVEQVLGRGPRAAATAATRRPGLSPLPIARAGRSTGPWSGNGSRSISVTPARALACRIPWTTRRSGRGTRRGSPGVRTQLARRLHLLEVEPQALWAKGPPLLRPRPRIAIVGSRADRHYGETQARRFGYSSPRAASPSSAVSRGASTRPPTRARSPRVGRPSRSSAPASTAPRPEGPSPPAWASRVGLLSSSRRGPAHAGTTSRCGTGSSRPSPTPCSWSRRRSPPVRRLITARWAADQGQDVFALPGRVDHPMALGTLRVIREGGEPRRRSRHARGGRLRPGGGAGRDQRRLPPRRGTHAARRCAARPSERRSSPTGSGSAWARSSAVPSTLELDGRVVRRRGDSTAALTGRISSPRRRCARPRA